MPVRARLQRGFQCIVFAASGTSRVSFLLPVWLSPSVAAHVLACKHPQQGPLAPVVHAAALAGYLAQCGMQPELSLILKELFDVQQTSVSTMNPLAYMREGEHVSFEELTERVRANRQTLIGYVDRATKSVPISRKGEAVKWEEVQSLIVLAG